MPSSFFPFPPYQTPVQLSNVSELAMQVSHVSQQYQHGRSDQESEPSGESILEDIALAREIADIVLKDTEAGGSPLHLAFPNSYILFAT